MHARAAALAAVLAAQACTSAPPSLCERYTAQVLRCDEGAATTAPQRDGKRLVRKMCEAALSGSTGGASPEASAVMREVFVKVRAEIECGAASTTCAAFKACKPAPELAPISPAASAPPADSPAASGGADAPTP